MLRLPTRAGRRAVSTLSALLVAPMFLTSTVTFAAPPAATPDQVAKHDDKAYTLARTFKAKEVNRYKMGITTNIDSPQIGNIDVIVTVIFRETTKEIKDNGNAVLLNEFDSASAKFGEMEKDLTASLPTITTTIDKLGHVLDTKVEGGDPMMTQQMTTGMMGGMGQQGYFPAKPVKVGDTWKIEVPAKDKNSAKVTGVATFLGTDMLNGMQTYKVKMVTDSESTMDNPQNPGETLTIKMHSNGVTSYDALSGKMVKVTLTSTSEGTPLGKSKSDMSITLVTGDDKPKEDAKPADPIKPAEKTDKPKN